MDGRQIIYLSRSSSRAALWNGIRPGASDRFGLACLRTISAGTVGYSAPHEVMGFVIATDPQTHRELWRERIYRPIIDPSLERDVQECSLPPLNLSDKSAGAFLRRVATP